MRLNIFGKKQPTVAQVEAEQQALAERRAGIQQRLKEIEGELVGVYGSQTDTAALHNEANNLERELRTCAAVSAELEAARHEAVKRAALEQVRAHYKALAADIDELLKLTPQVDDLERRYVEQRRREDALRGLIFAKLYTTNGVDHLLQEHGVRSGEFASEIEAIKAEFPQLQREIAATRKAYKNFNQIGLGVTHDEQ